MFYFDTSFLTPLIRVQATTAHRQVYRNAPGPRSPVEKSPM